MVNRERQPHLAHLTVARLPTDPLMRSVSRHDGYTNWITDMTFSQGVLSRRPLSIASQMRRIYIKV
jgi:hypothetical protein